MHIVYSAFESTKYYNDSANWENDFLYIGNHLVDAKSIYSLHESYAIKPGTLTIADWALRFFDNKPYETYKLFVWEDLDIMSAIPQ